MKNKIKKIPYNKEIYTSIPTPHLIIFGIYSILQRRENCTFEKLIEKNKTPLMFYLTRALALTCLFWYYNK